MSSFVCVCLLCMFLQHQVELVRPLSLYLYCGSIGINAFSLGNIMHTVKDKKMDKPSAILRQENFFSYTIQSQNSMLFPEL
jgi:hypothetical protein